MKGTNSQFGVGRGDQHGYLDLGSGDDIDVDALFRERREHFLGDAGMALHADADDRYLRDIADHFQPLIAEIETYRGCVRYASGGCSFCVEPLKGRPVHRSPKSIVSEVRELHRLGVRNFRLGAQTCFVSYMSHEDGSETPRPNPQAIEELLAGIDALGVDVLHLDNANPAVIATHPEESRAILRSIARHCTSGNVLALGVESADPAVLEANNLNSTADQALEAIRLINQEGRERGPTGLPMVLPGLNFIIGLDGETASTLGSTWSS